MEFLRILLALLAYGGLHSLMATTWFKTVSARLMGERAYLGLYRMLYSVISALTLLPILALIVDHPGRTLWSVQRTIAGILLVVRALGVIGLVMALLQIDLLRFLGIKDLIAFISGRPLPLPAEPLSIRGLYRFVRHPLYLFSLLALWASPSMNMAGLGFVVGSTVYFVLGSMFEERRMIHSFGDDYIEYRRTVPWMIPFLKRRLVVACWQRFSSRPARS
jgi:protein-S-isoprenylcysteine O-methyltransferase Ste14